MNQLINQNFMDISKLSKEQKAELKAQFDAEENAKKERIVRERETYKEMVDNVVNANFEVLREVSSTLLRVKQHVFDEFSTLIATKDELFKTKLDRQTNTFTTNDGRTTITLGNRVNESWDDTVEAGIEKVKEYLATLAKDDNSAALVDTVMSLLAKNRKGALKANKVLELEKLAIKSKNEGFLDAINIIKAAYRPVPTCQFIQVEFKDDEGKTITLPLSMSAI